MRVVPAQNAKERPYIARNIAATRKALGIDHVNEVNFNYQENLDAGALQRNADTVRNLRLWDPKFTLASFSQNQKLRAYAQAQEDYERQRQADGQLLDGQQREQILALATDFPRLWQDPAVPQRERKRMIRLLLEDVTLLRADEVVAHIRFRGGATHSLHLPLPLSAWQLRKTDPPWSLKSTDSSTTTPRPRSLTS